MVSIEQHELNLARNEGYVAGHSAASGFFRNRIHDIEDRHRATVDAKNIEMRNLASQLREQATIISALQQSLEEATARINVLTAKPPFKVGDRVWATTGSGEEIRKYLYDVYEVDDRGEIVLVAVDGRPMQWTKSYTWTKVS